ncbi:helix-turn-helix domain-containing protein [Irregularibacter muris]|nr:helix-turn-helix transcriptional regulator [Irregularibacter muris]
MKIDIKYIKYHFKKGNKTMNFNERLIELRKAKGLSQEQLGEKLNVARQTVSKWELGTTTPEMNKLIVLANLFNISLDELVGNSSSVENRQSVSYRFEYEYSSKTKIMGLPLVHINIGYGRRKAKGIVAIGNIAKGLLSIGGLSIGIFSIGGLSLGLFTLAGLSLGLLLAVGGIAMGAISIGGLSIGIFAVGGFALGIYSIGGCSIAQKIAMGGYASGHIAIGEETNGTINFISKNNFNHFTSSDIKNAIIKEFPDTWDIIVSIFSNLW